MIGDLPPGATRLVLVRHCEADVAPGILCGRLDPPLAPPGRAHAERLAAWLSSVPLAAAYASPARRAVATAEAIAAPRGLDVTCDEALWEVAFGTFEGLTWEEAAALHPAVCETWLASPHEVVFPGGEGHRDVGIRSVGAVDAILARHQGSTVLVVAHGGVNRAVLAWALGVTPERAFHLDQRHGCVNVLDRFADKRFALRLLNGAG